MNHKDLSNRLALVNQILADHNLEAETISPLAYDPSCPFPYNNFTYHISLTSPLTPQPFLPTNKPCVISPPQEGRVTSLIVRLSNPPADGITQTNGVQNEVAALYLARRSGGGILFPAVYDWRASVRNTAEEGWDMGWITQEFKPGVGLDELFDSLSSEEKRGVVGQVADAFAAIQRVRLPDGVTGYGGLNIAEEGDGKIVGGEMTTLQGGPWDDYASFWRAKLVSRLGEADGSLALGGWRENGVRERVEGFVTGELEGCLRGAGVDGTARVLTHGDVTTSNILIDPETLHLTGVIDFDFASIGHPAQEFLSSFHDPAEEGRMWEEALAKRGLLRPATIRGMETLELLGRLDELLAPFRLVHPVPLGKKTEEQVRRERMEAEERLVECLNTVGA
ncbi:aminoglycoside phosphotransferase [Coniochaeta sp. 2T2.1]|nr:aminoglycoside phosphotransferase [Coniochaeta sp. 2T2.1]